MGVRVDHGDDRLLRPVLEVQSQRGRRAFHRDQRVEQDQAGIALDDRQVRDVVVADLVEPVDDFEQPALCA
jgi:hypothetical protein